MPPTTTFSQPVVKLSKLVKKDKQLGCETFSGTGDVVTTKNWLERFSDTLIDMELEDELKLRVSTRLIDKSAFTWLDNLKLRSNILIT